MEKRLQVFISSTFVDMKKERQATVEAILKMNHIPAGMELFTGENKDQFEMIKSWINQSDIFIILDVSVVISISYTSVIVVAYKFNNRLTLRFKGDKILLQPFYHELEFLSIPFEKNSFVITNAAN